MPTAAQVKGRACTQVRVRILNNEYSTFDWWVHSDRLQKCNDVLERL